MRVKYSDWSAGDDIRHANLLCVMHAPNMSAMGLAEIRRRKHLRQADLAALVGVEQPTISRAEKLHPSTTLGVYIRCAEVLGVTLGDIFGQERSEREERLLRIFRSLQGGTQTGAWAELLQIVVEDAGPEAARTGKVADRTKP